MCVVNAHLAAHDHMLDERIKDFEKIVDEHKFHVKGMQEIFQHEYVYPPSPTVFNATHFYLQFFVCWVAMYSGLVI